MQRPPFLTSPTTYRGRALFPDARQGRCDQHCDLLPPEKRGRRQSSTRKEPGPSSKNSGSCSTPADLSDLPSSPPICPSFFQKFTFQMRGDTRVTYVFLLMALFLAGFPSKISKKGKTLQSIPSTSPMRPAFLTQGTRIDIRTGSDCPLPRRAKLKSRCSVNGSVLIYVHI